MRKVWLRRTIVTIGTGAALAALLAALRPATILSARVTSVAGGSVPLATLALIYSGGALPSSVVVDVMDTADGDRVIGSATIPGGRWFADIPLERAGGGPYRVATRADYRLLGGAVVRRRQF